MKSLFSRKKKKKESSGMVVQPGDVDRLMQDGDLTTGLWGGDDVIGKIHLLVDNIIEKMKIDRKKISYLGIQAALKKYGNWGGLDFNDATTFNTQYRPHIKTSPAFIKWKLNEERKEEKERSDEESSDEERPKFKSSSLEMVNLGHGGRKTRRKRKRTRKKTRRKRTKRTRRKRTRRKRKRRKGGKTRRRMIGCKKN